MKKSKLIAVILVCLLTLNLNLVFAENGIVNNATEYDNYNSTTFMNLDMQGKAITEKKFVHSEIKINLIEVSGSNMAINGYVKYNGKEKIDFALQGNLARSEQNNEMVIAELTDLNNNFDVVYCAIKSNPEDGFIINKDNIKINKSLKNTIFSLYLMEKGTRNFSTLEVLNPKFIDCQSLFNKESSLKMAMHKDEFWYAKIIKPVNFETIDVTSPVYSLTPSTIFTNSAQNYRYTYNVGGALVYEDFIVNHYLQGPDTISPQGSYSSSLQLQSERTWSSSLPSMNSDDTNTTLGCYDATKVDTYTDPGDYVSQATWDKNCYIPWSFTPSYSVSVGLSLYNASVSYGYNYNPPINYTACTYRTFTQSGSNISRTAGISYVQGMQLNAVGHSFDQGFILNKYNTPGYKYFRMRWTYDISNGLDYSWAGIQSKELSLRYNCL